MRNDQEEILFPTHFVVRTQKVKKINEGGGLWLRKASLLVSTNISSDIERTLKFDVSIIGRC